MKHLKHAPSKDSLAVTEDVKAEEFVVKQRQPNYTLHLGIWPPSLS